MRHDIRAKADGQVDGKPDDDWIIDAQTQEKICGMVDALIAYLDSIGISFFLTGSTGPPWRDFPGRRVVGANQVWARGATLPGAHCHC